MAEINITNAKTAWVTPLVYSIILIIAGIGMIVFKSEALRWILIVTGVLAVIGNTIELVIILQKKILPVIPIIGIVIGVLLILLPGLMADIAIILLGVFLIIYGVLNVIGSIMSGDGTIALVIGVIIGVLAVAAGIYTLFNINDTKDVVMIIVGAITVVIGAINAIGAVKLYMQYH